MWKIFNNTGVLNFKYGIKFWIMPYEYTTVDRGMSKNEILFVVSIL